MEVESLPGLLVKRPSITTRTRRVMPPQLVGLVRRVHDGARAWERTG